MASEILLPGGGSIVNPSEDTLMLLEALQAVNMNLVGLSRQIEVLIRLECNYDKRAMWRERFAEAEKVAEEQAILQEAAAQASFVEATLEEAESEAEGADTDES